MFVRALGAGLAFFFFFFIRSACFCRSFSGSGWSEELPIAPVLRHRKGPLFAQVSPDSSALPLGLWKRCGRTNQWGGLLSPQENPDAATQQAGREEGRDG